MAESAVAASSSGTPRAVAAPSAASADATRWRPGSGRRTSTLRAPSWAMKRRPSMPRAITSVARSAASADSPNSTTRALVRGASARTRASSAFSSATPSFGKASMSSAFPIAIASTLGVRE